MTATMSHVWAAVLGVVQGLTEFLPISSTAHLKLIPWAFGIQTQYPVLASAQFDIALHAGSFVAIVLALWKDWVELVGGALRGDRDSWRFIGFLLLTSVPGALIGVAFESKVEFLAGPLLFHWAPLVIGVSIIVFGLVLWAVDTYAPTGEELDSMKWWQALTIGVAQAAALIPGVSRSGATITAGRALGIKRDAVAKYSFMAALPIIGGAAVFGLRHVPPTQLLSVDWVIGFTAAAVSSVLAMRLMLGWVRRHSFAPFAVYRVVVGLLVIALFVMRG